MFGFGKSNRLDKIEAAIAELIALQQATSQTVAATSQTVQATSYDVAHLVETQEGIRQDLAHLAETVSIQAQNIAGLVQIAQSHETELAALRSGARELQAGQAQQQAVLDYLLKKEQERQNGSSNSG
jgi:chromosome segregation ATPase